MRRRAHACALTVTLAGDGCQYVVVNRLNRQAAFRDGIDMRKIPYRLRVLHNSGPDRRAR